MLLGLLVLLGAAVCYAVLYAFRLLRGYRRRRMFEPLFGSLCDGVGQTGISVVSVGTGSAGTVASLLRSEYERYEAVVMVDSVRDRVLLRSLVDRYSLVAVDYQRPAEFAHSLCVRTLYRSRCRRFRRLTVVDAASFSERTDIEVAADIAMYEYVVPIDGTTVLLPFAVERMVAEIAASPHDIRKLRTEAGERLSLFRRSDLLCKKGGGQWRCRRRNGCRIYETLAVCDRQPRQARVIIVAVAVVTAVALSASLMAGSLLPLAVMAAGVTAILSSVLFSMPFVAPHLHGKRAFGYTLRNFLQRIVPTCRRRRSL